MAEDTFTASDFSAPSGGESVPAEPSAPAPDPISPTEGAATIAPGAEGSGVAAISRTDSKPAGPVPFEVHKTALENARAKAVAEWDTQYGWAKQVDRQALARAVDLARRFQGDPVDALQQLIQEVQQDPVHGAKLKSLAAKALSARAAATSEEPKPDLVWDTGTGQKIPIYSAEQQAKREAWAQQRWMAQMDQRLSPLQQAHQRLEGERATLQAQREVESYVSTTYQDVQAWPGMDSPETRHAVAAELAAMRLPSDDPRDVTLALNAAYRKVVVPTLNRSARQAVLTSIQQQAHAGTVNPAQRGTKPAKTYDDMSIAEALAFEAARQAT